jgi:hypothetical protein
MQWHEASAPATMWKASEHAIIFNAAMQKMVRVYCHICLHKTTFKAP